MRSAGFRFFLVAALSLLMFFPLTFVADLAGERKRLSERTIEVVGREWGGAQDMTGPFLTVPVMAEVERVRTEAVVDPETQIVQRDANGAVIERQIRTLETVAAPPLYFLPQSLIIDVQSQNQVRARGIYEVPVYTADLAAQFTFDTSQVSLGEGETALWDQSEIIVQLATNKSIRGQATLVGDETAFTLNPSQASAAFKGIVARVGDPRSRDSWSLNLQLNGAESLFLSAVGRQTQASITSDWPDPSFRGQFLPTDHSVTDAGFTAQWSIPHVARNVAQTGRGMEFLSIQSQTHFGVIFFQPGSFYKKAYSAANYALLFIALTFLTVMLMTTGRERGVHPVQYLLIGVAKAVFVILMLAYAEHLGFTLAFLIASGATIALLTLYGWTALALGVRTWVLFAVLVLVYAIQFLILQSQDYALVVGATLAFLALAAAMIFTRNEQWYGAPSADRGTGGGGGWFSRWRPKAEEPPVQKPVEPQTQ